MAQNITEVRLLSVPLDKEYKNTIYFSSPSEQYDYFVVKQQYSEFDLSYQREDGCIRFPRQYDKLLNCNYVMFKNTAYNSTKWFYAFITDKKYINDNRTDIYFKIDAIQTWMFDISVKASFIEREHVDDDSFGLHLQDENLALGEYVCNKHSKAGIGSLDLKIVVGVTKTPDGSNVVGVIYNNVFSGIKYYAFDNDEEGWTALCDFILGYDEDAAADAIQVMFLAPGNMISSVYIGNDHGISSLPEVNRTTINADPFVGALQITTNKLDGNYTPRNNKLMSYPYRYLMTSNNSGAAIPFHYEDFENCHRVSNNKLGQPGFIVKGCLTPGCSIRLIPTNFKGVDIHEDEGIPMGKFPILNWTSDYYTNWLTQNGTNNAIGVATGVTMALLGVVGAAATGGASLGVTAAAAGAVVGGVSTVSNSMQARHQAALVPPQSKGNINCGDVVTASGQNDFHFYDMSIKEEYAKIIDEYFDAYGYKVNTLKVPNTNHRKYYWYTKTLDANIYGNIPQEDLQTIKDCYNRGITFWRDTKYFGDYTLGNHADENSIV